MNKLADLQEQILEPQIHLEGLNEKLSASNQFYHNLFGQYMSETLLEQALKGGIKTWRQISLSNLIRSKLSMLLSVPLIWKIDLKSFISTMFSA